MRIKRIVTFAPALRMKAQIKKRRHVPRHIELTAVLKETSKQNKESKIIERFELEAR